jgi:hypothetical protein
MSGVQEYLIDQELKTTKQLAEIAITKVLPTMFDLTKGMALWLCKQSGGEKTGQQTLKQLTKHGDKLSEIPLDSNSIKEFTHIARKHGVSFAMAKDGIANPPRHTVYFKSKDTESMSAAFKEYIATELNKSKTNEKPFKERLNNAKEKVKVSDKEKTAKREVEGR